MKIYRRHIVTVLAAFMFLSASCGDRDVLIPRDKMAEIYAEMLMTDQWITSNQGVRQIADTSWVYEPILEKYGYDSGDYRKSVDRYMDDPERFAKILRTTGEILQTRLDDLEKEQARLDAIARIPIIKSDFKVTDYVPYWKGEYYVHYFDSLNVTVDSVKHMYMLESIERADTLYDRIRMVKPEDPADTLKLKDTKVAVSVKKLDSLKLKRPAYTSGRHKRPLNGGRPIKETE